MNEKEPKFMPEEVEETEKKAEDIMTGEQRDQISLKPARSISEDMVKVEHNELSKHPERILQKNNDGSVAVERKKDFDEKKYFESKKKYAELLSELRQLQDEAEKTGQDFIYDDINKKFAFLDSWDKLQNKKNEMQDEINKADREYGDAHPTSPDDLKFDEKDDIIRRYYKVEKWINAVYEWGLKRQELREGPDNI